jgi:uncharacterized protein YegP (UPF0339 family)
LNLNEGTWALKARRTNTAIKELEQFRKKWWNVIGDDELYDHIDAAIDRIRTLKRNSEKAGVADKKPALASIFESVLKESDDVGWGAYRKGVRSIHTDDIFQTQDECKDWISHHGGFSKFYPAPTSLETHRQII